MVIQVFDSQQKKQVAGDILHQLPDWFGLPESTKRYIEESAGMPFWAWCGDKGGSAETSGDIKGTDIKGLEEFGRDGMAAGGAARKGCGGAVGFLALKETSPHTAEIYVMGVLPQCHHSGIGRALYEKFERYAREKGYSFLQVKTVQEGRYEEYDRTNAFYRAMGFLELECFPTLWDEWNPCQVYVKYIGTK